MSEVTTFDTAVIMKVYPEGVTGRRTKLRSSHDKWMVPNPGDPCYQIVAYGNRDVGTGHLDVAHIVFLKSSGETVAISPKYWRSLEIDDEECFFRQSEKVFPFKDSEVSYDIHDFLENCILYLTPESCGQWSSRTHICSTASDTILLPRFTRQGPAATPSDVLVCVQRHVYSVSPMPLVCVTQLKDVDAIEAFLQEQKASLGMHNVAVLLRESRQISRTRPWTHRELRLHIQSDDEHTSDDIALAAQIVFGGGPNSSWGLWEFSERTIPWLDFTIETHLGDPKLDSPDLKALELTMGGYLTVVIGMNYHGKWSKDVSATFRFDARNSNTSINPCIWVRNRFQRGLSIASQYQAACRQMTQDRREDSEDPWSNAWPGGPNEPLPTNRS